MEIDSNAWRQAVMEGASALGVRVTVDQSRAMGRHAAELLQWNRTTNLTAITDPLDVAVKHVVDALAAASWIESGSRLMDAGSGGGFPGIPLKIARPDLSVVLVDSVRKKVSFLKHVIRTLALNDIEAVHGRLEDLSETAHFAGQFDLVVCRAFSSLGAFVRLARPFLSPTGRLLAMKGPQADASGEAPGRWGDGPFSCGGSAYTMRVHRYRLPRANAGRTMVMLTPNTVS